MPRHSEIKKNALSGLYTHNSNSVLTVSVREMMWRSVRVSCCLVADSHQQVLRNVSAGVLKRYNSTAAVAQVRPEEWDCAKPFEDIPGPKPLPIIGNMWRFIPYIGKVSYCFVIPFKVHQQSESSSKNLLI
jgi:hypothetical protein